MNCPGCKLTLDETTLFFYNLCTAISSDKQKVDLSAPVDNWLEQVLHASVPAPSLIPPKSTSGTSVTFPGPINKGRLRTTTSATAVSASGSAKQRTSLKWAHANDEELANGENATAVDIFEEGDQSKEHEATISSFKGKSMSMRPKLLALRFIAHNSLENHKDRKLCNCSGVEITNEKCRPPPKHVGWRQVERLLHSHVFPIPGCG